MAGTGLRNNEIVVEKRTQMCSTHFPLTSLFRVGNKRDSYLLFFLPVYNLDPATFSF